MGKCKDCIWHYKNVIMVCGQKPVIICSVKHEQVSENDSCERFVEK